MLALAAALSAPASHEALAQAAGGVKSGVPPAARVRVAPAIQGTPAEVRLLRFGSQRANADTLAARLLAEAERRHGPNSVEVADALDLLVWVRTTTGVDAPAYGKALIDRSRRLAERAFALKDSLLSPDDPRRAASLDHMAEVAWFDGDTARAWALARRSLAIRESAYGPEHTEVALSLRQLGLLAQRSGDFPAARSLYERSLGMQDRMLGPFDLEIAQTLEWMAYLAFLSKAPYRASIPLFRRSLEIVERNLGPNCLTTIANTTGLAQQLRAVSPAEAESLLVHAIAIGEEVLGPRNAIVARAYAELIGHYAVHFDRERGMAVADTGTSRFPGNFFLQVMAGNFYDLVGDYERALGAYSQAVRAVEQKLSSYRMPHHLGWALASRGLVLTSMGQYGEARADFVRARAIFDSLEANASGGPDDVMLFEARVFAPAPRLGLARLLVKLGDYRDGRTQYEGAIEASLSAVGDSGAWMAAETALDRCGFGEALLQMGDPLAARLQFEEAERAWTQDYALGTPPGLDILIGQAQARLALGDRESARALFARSLELAEQHLAPDHPSVARSLEGMARVEIEAERLGPAAAHLARATAIEERTFGSAHPSVAASLRALAELELQRGDLRAALTAATRAEAASREHTRLVSQALPERRALGLVSVRQAGLDCALAAAVTLGDSDAARASWDAVLRSRALVLDEMASRRKAAKGAGDLEADSLARELGRARTRLANLTIREARWTVSAADTVPEALKRRSERVRQLFRGAREEKERLEEALAARSIAFRAERAREALGYAEVARALPEGAALVAYVRYAAPVSAANAGAVASARLRERDARERYAAFVLRAGAASPTLVALGEARGIAEPVRRWRDAAVQMDGGEAAYRRAGEALRRRVWDPLAPHLAGATRVFVVPDGELNLVSLATLPAAGDGYLVEHGPALHYLSAERDLVARGDEAAGSGLLALGDPAFDAREDRFASIATATYRGPRSGCAGFRAERFAALPGTAAEVREVGGQWRGAKAPGALQMLTGGTASEATFKAGAPGQRVLHLATHGFFLGGECRPALERTRGMGGLAVTEPPAREVGENPLLLSGLALAGANRREEAGPDEEDGILTAEEIASLDLSGVEWAVLSACETGVGEVRAGEGVFGLRRAFQVAGARTLIMSLWSVEDEATRSWMRALYGARLERKLDTAESVRAASLAVLAERRAKGLSTHPFWWGAFVAAGDWR